MNEINNKKEIKLKFSSSFVFVVVMSKKNVEFEL
jgi:hypothetical protein